MRTQAWSVLSEGSGRGRLVIAVDFDGGRPQATFRHLAQLLPLEWTVLLLQPPAHIPLDLAAVEDLFSSWIEGLAPYGRQVGAILANCAGACAALRLATELAPACAPKIVLLDPEFVSAALLHGEYQKSLSLVATAKPQQQEPVNGQPLGPLAEQLSSRYEAQLVEAGASMGLGRELTAELVAQFRRYMGYLVAAGTGPRHPSAANDVLTIHSTGCVLPEDGHWGKRMAVDLPDGQALADSGVARTIADFVGGTVPQTSSAR